MRLCSVVDRGCDIQGRYTCYRCGDACCGECSGLRPYGCYLGHAYKERPRRICNECWDEEEAEVGPERFEIKVDGRGEGGSWLLEVAEFNGDDWLEDLWQTLNVSYTIENGTLILRAGPHPQREVARWSGAQIIAQVRIQEEFDRQEKADRPSGGWGRYAEEPE